MAIVEEFKTASKRAAGQAGVATGSKIAKSFLGWLGIPIASALIVAMDVWDYMFKKEKIVSEYEKEIAYKLNKRPEAVTRKDLDTVAQENPTLGEALKRIKRKRDLDITTNIACTIGSFFLVAAIASPIGLAVGGGIATALLIGSIGFAGFLTGKYILDKIGDHMLGLHEPSIRKVEREPILQEKLSVPSQVTYLQQLQHNRKDISPQQIAILYQTAQSPLTLAEAETIAEKLNDGKIDATELAFTVYGQKSGVPERESKALSRHEQVITDLKEQLSSAHDRLKEASGNAKEKAGDLMGTVKDKSEEMGNKATSYWRDKFGGDKRTPPVTPESIIAQHQQEQASGITP